MKTTLFAAAALGMTGTSAFACSLDAKAEMSTVISSMVHEIVTQDEASLGGVMSVMQAAAAAEYHAGPSAPACARQAQIIAGLTALADGDAVQQSAMLATDNL